MNLEGIDMNIFKTKYAESLRFKVISYEIIENT